MKSLHSGSPHAIIKSVELLGSDRPVKWTRDGDGLHIEAEPMQTRNPVVFRVRAD